MTGHLIHIGFPKAASTLLQQWFAEHPQLAYAPGAIAGFRDVRDISGSAATGESGLRYRVTSSETFSAPLRRGSSAYIDYRANGRDCRARQAEACRLLAAIAPQAHVLIVTRGFRSMILSSYSQYVRSGGAEDLEALFGEEQEDPWHYDFVADLYRRAFGAERVLILPYELLRDDREAFGSAIARWLGIDPHPLPRETVNRSLSPVELRWYPRITRAIERLPVGAPARRWLLHRHAAAAMANRRRRAIGLLQRLRPAAPVWPW